MSKFLNLTCGEGALHLLANVDQIERIDRIDDGRAVVWFSKDHVLTVDQSYMDIVASLETIRPG